MWRTGSDRSRNEGFTTVNLELTDNKTALFQWVYFYLQISEEKNTIQRF